jgi:hypothetical protein
VLQKERDALDVLGTDGVVLADAATAKRRDDLGDDDSASDDVDEALGDSCGEDLASLETGYHRR